MRNDTVKLKCVFRQSKPRALNSYPKPAHGESPASATEPDSRDGGFVLSPGTDFILKPMLIGWHALPSNPQANSIWFSNANICTAFRV